MAHGTSFVVPAASMLAQNMKSSPGICTFGLLLLFSIMGMGQQRHETLLSAAENAYNPIASADGKYIAYVRTGRAHENVGGFGRSNLRSDIAFMDSSGNVLTNVPPATCFLQGWVGEDVVCYRDRRYYLVSPPGTIAREGRLNFVPPQLGAVAQSERVAYLSSRDEFVWADRIDPEHSRLSGS